MDGNVAVRAATMLLTNDVQWLDEFLLSDENVQQK